MADATQVQIRRDTAANLNPTTGATPALAELAYNITNKRLHLGDGVTPGGIITPNASDIQQNNFNYGGVAGGTADALTVTLTPTPTVITSSSIKFKAASNNTGPATLSVNGGLATPIKKQDGALIVDLEADDIVAGGMYEVVFDGTNFFFRVGKATSVPLTLTPGSNIVAQWPLNTTTSISTPFSPFPLAKLWLQFGVAYSGIVTSSFEIRRTSGSGSIEGRIYKNNAALGTLRSTTSGSFVTYTEDISVNAGDTIQLWGRNNSGGTGSGAGQARNFQLKAAEIVPSFVTWQ